MKKFADILRALASWRPVWTPVRTPAWTPVLLRLRRWLAVLAALVGLAREFGLWPEAAAQLGAVLKLLLAVVG